jgi:hypothetical protein
MRVDQAGDDPPAGQIDFASFLGKLESGAGPYRLDPALANDNSGVY